MAEKRAVIDARPQAVIEKVLTFARWANWERLSGDDAYRPAFPRRWPPGESTVLFFWKPGGFSTGGQRIAVSVERHEPGRSLVVVKTQAKLAQDDSTYGLMLASLQRLSDSVGLSDRASERGPDGARQLFDWGDGRRIAARLLDALTKELA